MGGGGVVGSLTRGSQVDETEFNVYSYYELLETDIHIQSISCEKMPA